MICVHRLNVINVTLSCRKCHGRRRTLLLGRSNVRLFFKALVVDSEGGAVWSDSCAWLENCLIEVTLRMSWVNSAISRRKIPCPRSDLKILLVVGFRSAHSGRTVCCFLETALSSALSDDVSASMLLRPLVTSFQSVVVYFSLQTQVLVDVALQIRLRLDWLIPLEFFFLLLLKG